METRIPLPAARNVRCAMASCGLSRPPRYPRVCADKRIGLLGPVLTILVPYGPPLGPPKAAVGIAGLGSSDIAALQTSEYVPAIIH
jgi:hypothetical protein